MIGNSLPEYVCIRLCIAFLRLVAPASILYILLSAYLGSWLFSSVLGFFAVPEALFYLLVYLPRKKRLQQVHSYRTFLKTRTERTTLFRKCSTGLGNHITPSDNLFPRGWFLPKVNCQTHTIQRQDVVSWLLWALFLCSPAENRDEWNDELDAYVEEVERLLGHPLEDVGESTVRSMRITLDPVKMAHRPLLWYMIVCLVDILTSLTLLLHGFKHYTSTRKWFSTFPPRPLLSLLSTYTEVHDDVLLPYWYRPHKSTEKFPVVFMHGIGVGLHPYIPFVRDLIAQDPDVGILLIELLPISSRMTSDPVASYPAIASTLDNILQNHGINRFVLAAHSYSTFISSCILHDSCGHPLVKKIAHVLLIDPIPFLLHLPPVAYNFLHRPPRTAAQWQLWYFASMDPDVARTLGRSFFWTEGVAWKEDLRRWMRIEGHRLPDSIGANGDGEQKGRNIAIVLSGADQIVPAEMLRRYLTGEPEPSSMWVRKGWADRGDDEEDYGGMRQSGIHGDLEVLFYPGLDHATVFDTAERRTPLVNVLNRFVHST